MNPHLCQLHPYPFEKLAELKRGITPETDHPAVLLSVGEPQHRPPAIVLSALIDNLGGISSYPSTRGSDELRSSISNWLSHRFDLGQNGIDPDSQILPVNGTREALFAFAQCVINSTHRDDLVLMPNPFYQIYEGAATLAGLSAQFYNTGVENNYQPDFDSIDDADWKRCQMVYLCTPGNPTGSVIAEDVLAALIERAIKHNFVIAADECYSEIYNDESRPPPGLLQACKSIGNTHYSNCIVFHSLSKRSNLPGMRSGFVAGDAAIIKDFFRYRTYHGCSMSPVVQSASTVAWSDEQHVKENRQLYREKFDAVLNILNDSLAIERPSAGFYLWPELAVDDETFAQTLYKKHNITVLPGRYLARDKDGINPGRNHVRIALVAEQNDCVYAAECIRDTLESI